MAKNISKVIKRIITIVCALAVLISMIPTENIAYASTKVGKTSKITFPKYSTLDGAPYYKPYSVKLTIVLHPVFSAIIPAGN